MLERSIVAFFLLLLSLPIFHSMVTIISSKEDIAQEVIAEELSIKAVNINQLKCLATGIYYEAAGEPVVGQIAVARVIMNRVLHGFGKDPCEVVYQTTTKVNDDGEKIKLCQFSWVCDGKTMPSESNSRFVKAQSIAKQVLEEDKWSDLLPNNTLFFHNLAAAPGWTYKLVAKIGNHLFYSKGREKNTEQANVDKY